MSNKLITTSIFTKTKKAENNSIKLYELVHVEDNIYDLYVYKGGYNFDINLTPPNPIYIRKVICDGWEPFKAQSLYISSTYNIEWDQTSSDRKSNLRAHIQGSLAPDFKGTTTVNGVQTDGWKLAPRIYYPITYYNGYWIGSGPQLRSYAYAGRVDFENRVYIDEDYNAGNIVDGNEFKAYEDTTQS